MKLQLFKYIKEFPRWWKQWNTFSIKDMLSDYISMVKWMPLAKSVRVERKIRRKPEGFYLKI